MSRCPHCGSVHDALNHFCPVTGQSLDLGPRLIGQILLAKYRVITVLGQGPIGIVLEVENDKTGKHYAAKLIHPQFTRGHNAADKLLREAKITAEISCDTLAKVIDCGRDVGGAPLVVRELMTGECLQTRLDGQTRFSLEEATHIGIGMARALDALHNKRVLNLDLSPTDVFLARVGNRVVPKLVDIGEHWIKSKLTSEQLREVDSHQYWAPEQIAKISPPGLRADIFGAGAVLFHILTGRALKSPSVRLSEVAPHVPAALAAVVEKATSRRPEDRYASAAGLAAALSSTLTPSMAPPQTAAPLPQTAAPPKRTSGPPKRTSAPPKRTSAPPKRTSAPPKRTSAPPPPTSEPPPQRTSDPPAQEPASIESAMHHPPSVIVDMPEMESATYGASRKKPWFIAAAVLLIAIAAGVFLGLSHQSSTPPTTDGPSIVSDPIEIKIDVKPASADVFVDGKAISNKPPTVETTADGKLHTIAAKADGYEPRERDVRFDKSQTVSLTLTEIVAPDDERQPTVAKPSDKADLAPNDVPTPATEKSPIVNNKPTAQKTGAEATPARKSTSKAAKEATAKQEKAKSRKARPQKTKQAEKKKTNSGFSLENPFN